MRDRLSEFIENIKLAPTDAFHEGVVRRMLEGLARDCPLPALLHLGRSLVDYRKAEIKVESERN